VFYGVVEIALAFEIKNLAKHPDEQPCSGSAPYKHRCSSPTATTTS
jgi:hypothetical protein